MQRTARQITVLLLFLISGSCSLLSQVAVERSKDKVVIAGIPYYIHTVKKGETLYSVSKAYGITPEELVRENPGSAGGLREGQNLRIKVSLVKPVQSAAPLTQAKRDDSKFIYHALKQGETVYFLSKQYNVTEDEIIKSNPGVDITKLPLGYEIAIPRKIVAAVQQPEPGRKMVPYYHKVVRGETMTSIARQYRVSVRELRRENRDIRFPQVGDFIRIPGLKVPESNLAQQPAADTIVTAPPEKPVYLERPAAFTPVDRLSGSLNVAVLLPFYLDENSKRTEIDSSVYQKGKRVYNVVNRPDDWIYPRSIGFIEMYQGILLAADTLRSLGLNISLNVWDIKSDTADVMGLIESGSLEGMDLIIGPVFSRNLAIVAAYAGQRGIPVVSPVQLSTNSLLLNNPTLFQAYPSNTVTESAIAEKMVDYKSDNIILLHSEIQADNQDLPGFMTKIRTDLEKSELPEEIKLRDFIFYRRSAFGNDSINRFARILSDNVENVVIIASEDDPVMGESLTEVHSVSRKYNLQVFGFPAMRYLDNFDTRICFELGLMIYSPYWIDKNNKNVKRFNSLFRDRFLTLPSETSYAWDGYDLAYYFLSGLALSGKDFIVHPEIHRPQLLHTDYEFRRNSGSDGFENQKLFLIKYTSDYDLELVTEPDHNPMVY